MFALILQVSVLVKGGDQMNQFVRGVILFWVLPFHGSELVVLNCLIFHSQYIQHVDRAIIKIFVLRNQFVLLNRKIKFTS